MLKIILGVIAGFIAWSVLWVGSDQALIATLGWYGAHQHEFQNALANKLPFEPNITILLMNLFRSVIISIASGYIAALIAKENRISPLFLGILLLAFGIMVEVIAWNYLPVWYHLIFLILLLPLTIAGGKLRKAG